MPCYNCAATVEKSINSIYEQGISIPFEVICTDDASTDNTLEILRSCEEKHANLHVYAHKYNQGGGVASNTCVSHSLGDLLFRLDSDNMLAPDTINKLIDLIDQTGCDGASVQKLYFFTKDYERRDTWEYHAPNNISDLQHIITGNNNPAHSGNYMYTRKSYNKAGGYQTTHGGGDTFCFGFKQFATGSKIAILPNTFYWHYQNPNGGYWVRSERLGINGKMALEVFKEYSEVFSLTSQKYLNNFSGNPLGQLGKGPIQLASTTVLNHIFEGYEQREKKQPQQAAQEFERAIAAGCQSKKIENLIAELKASN